MSSYIQPMQPVSAASNYSISEPTVFENVTRWLPFKWNSAIFRNCQYDNGIECTGNIKLENTTVHGLTESKTGNIEAIGCPALQGVKANGTVKAEVSRLRFVHAHDTATLENTIVNGYVLSDIGKVEWRNKEYDEQNPRVKFSEIRGSSTVTVSYIDGDKVESTNDKVTLKKCNVNEVISNETATIVSSHVKKLTIKVYRTECEINLSKSTVDEVIISYEKAQPAQAAPMNFSAGSLYSKQGIRFESSGDASVNVHIGGLCSTDGKFSLSSFNIPQTRPAPVPAQVRVNVNIIGGDVKKVSYMNCQGSLTTSKEL